MFKAFLTAVLCLGITACSASENSSLKETSHPDTLTKIKNLNQIRIGVQTNTPPFGFINFKGNNAGLEIDIARYITKQILGDEATIRFIPILDAKQRITLLQQGRVDLVIAAIEDTPVNRQAINLSIPYYAMGLGFLTRKDNEISTWSDLKGKEVCNVRGIRYPTGLNNLEVKLRTFRSADEVYLALQDGQCIGFIHHESVISGVLQSPNWSQNWHQGLTPVFSVPWVMGIRKGDTIFTKAIDNAILAMEAEGIVVKDEQKWNIAPSDYAQEKMSRAQRVVDVSATSSSPKEQIRDDSLRLTNNNVLIDGSALIFPMIAPIVEQFKLKQPNIRVALGTSGTTAGLQKLCQGEIDIATASHPITQAEMKECAKNSIDYLEIPFAFDGVVVVTNKQNTWSRCLSPKELKQILSSTDKITNWKQVSDRYRDQPLTLYRDDSDQESYDYFTEVTLGEEGASRTDYVANNNLDILAKAIASDLGSLGFVNFSVYQAKQELWQGVPIMNKKGRCIKPNSVAIGDGSYNPLNRPLFFYINYQNFQENVSVRTFVNKLFQLRNTLIISEAGYVPLPPNILLQVQKRYQARKTGSIFEGQSAIGVKITDKL